VTDFPIDISRHAWERMAEMDVDTDEVREVLQFPELNYPSTRPADRGTNRMVAVGGRLAVPYVPSGRTEGRPLVLTVLWHRKDAR
jgi:hypothetical protein